MRLLEIQPGDTGWDVFSLDYKVGWEEERLYSTRTGVEWVLARVWEVWQEDIKALVEKMIGVVVFVDKIVDIQRSDAFNKFK